MLFVFLHFLAGSYLIYGSVELLEIHILLKIQPE